MAEDRVVSLMRPLLMRRRTDLPTGWWPLYARLVDRLVALDRVPGFVVVERRLGRLHMRPVSSNPEATAMVAAAVEESMRTCDICGDEGRLCRKEGDWARRCVAHGGPADD